MARCFRFQGRNHLTKKRYRLFLHFSLPPFIAGCVCKRFFYLGQKSLCERYGLFCLFALNNHEFVHYEMQDRKSRRKFGYSVNCHSLAPCLSLI